MGVSQEVAQEAKAQDVSTFELVKSGAYKASVKEVAIFSTASGAKQLKIGVTINSLEDKLIEVYQNITKKNGEPNPIGTATYKHIIDAMGEEGLSVKTEKIKGYGKEVDAQCLVGLSNKTITVLVREVNEPGSTYENTNEIEGYLKADGTNADGEDIVPAFIEKIKKTPVLQKKPKAAQASSGTAGGTTDTTKEIEEML